MLMYARLLLYTVLSVSYGQVKLQDIHLTCPHVLLNGTQINLTCTVSTSYSSKCAASVDTVLFRYTYDENVYFPVCTTRPVTKCDFNQTSEDCGCVNRNNTHYTLKYTFIGSVSHNITWDCFINCLDNGSNPVLSFESKFCRRRNIESRYVSQGPSVGNQSMDTGLIIEIAVGVTVAVVAICLVVVLMFNKKNRSKSKGSDIETPVHKPPNENQEKETDKLLSTPVQKESESKVKLEKKENDGLSKPVQEETESNEKLEKKEIEALSKPVQEQTESKEKLEKKEIKDLSKPVQEQTESNEKQEKKDD